MDLVCSQLQIPMAAHKREGPATCLVILGIEIDSLAGELRLPVDKLTRLRTLLQQWGSTRKSSCSRSELESLIGHLNHACKVVRSGRSFLRRMLDLLHAVRPSQPVIRLNHGFRSDLAWWSTFITMWNGVSFPDHLIFLSLRLHLMRLAPGDVGLVLQLLVPNSMGLPSTGPINSREGTYSNNYRHSNMREGLGRPSGYLFLRQSGDSCVLKFENKQMQGDRAPSSLPPFHRG